MFGGRSPPPQMLSAIYDFPINYHTSHPTFPLKMPDMPPVPFKTMIHGCWECETPVRFFIDFVVFSVANQKNLSTANMCRNRFT